MAAPADGLKDIFQKCADIDLAWAIDQARIVTLQTKLNEPHSVLAREFCRAAAQALVESDPKRALDALQVSCDQADENGAALLKDTLGTMFKTSEEAALGSALLLRVRSDTQSPVFTIATNFLIEHSDVQTPQILKTVIGKDNMLSPDQIDKIMVRINEIAVSDPYEAILLARLAFDECTLKTPDQQDRLAAMNMVLSDDPRAMRRFLEVEHGETPPKADFVMPPSKTIH